MSSNPLRTQTTRDIGSLFRWILVPLMASIPYAARCHAETHERIVHDSHELTQAMETSSAGTEIILAPGTYPIYRMDTRTGGSEDQPITVKAMIPSTAILVANGVEAISVHHPYWVFENLVIRGTENSEHAFHLTGAADHAILRGNVIVNFNSHIKVNGDEQGFPSFGVLENNDLFNESTRQTDSSVTVIDIVGGDGWILRGNYIADFSKELSDRTSYGLFLKGNSHNGLIERNLVICEKSVTGEGIRIGISLGGGGTGQEFCANKDCTYEHSHGVIRNNVILQCSDVGIYLNRAQDSLIEHNTLLSTLGIDVRFPQSSAKVVNNILSSALREREGGRIESTDNLVFGTELGMVLPVVSARLKHRISDYDSKFPNWVSPETVRYWQGIIDGFFTRLGNTGLGLGTHKMEELFPTLAMGDLTPDVSDRNILLASSLPAGETVDFWGNRRSPDKNVLGAIDFFVSPCKILYRIRHQETSKLEPCLSLH
ncbi:MAG: right-handed parallel beta-helix repeat-containing protein [Methylococcaceae bacterium]|nr:right-handed parallel beta-helix repeat-containing protein [Methylococcaceae bacterium]